MYVHTLEISNWPRHDIRRIVSRPHHVLGWRGAIDISDAGEAAVAIVVGGSSGYGVAAWAVMKATLLLDRAYRR